MKEKEGRRRRRESLFPRYYFWLYLGILLLIGGVHSGLFCLMYFRDLDPIIQTHIILLYWIVVAMILSILAKKNIRKIYDEPLERLAEASRKVAEGDFSVYVAPVHTADRYDYLDRMILDFNKMVEELGSIETLKTDFFTNVSHEMKTPLAVIGNNAQLLVRQGMDEQQKQECAENILSAFRRMNGLITNMLKLGKLEKQTIQPAPERYDVCEQLAECVFQFESILDEKNLELEADLEDRAFVTADRELLELVWTNLISNAVKFTPDGGVITLSEYSGRDYARITVADTGCGMDKDTQKHIFDKFYQGDTSHASAGNGLGLALVKRILELSDGEIMVSSTPGKGSSFTVQLPLMRKDVEIE